MRCKIENERKWILCRAREDEDNRNENEEDNICELASASNYMDLGKKKLQN
jgi:hypothetical protein